MTRIHHHHRAHAGMHHSGLARFLLHPWSPNLGGLAHLLLRLAIDGLELAAAALGVVALIAAGRAWRQRRLAAGGRLYGLRLPEELDRGRLAQQLASLGPLRGGLFGRPFVGFELRVRDRSATPLVFCSAGVSEAQLAGLVAEAMPGAQLVPLEAASAPGPGVWRVASLVHLTGERQPLRTSFSADPAGLVVRRLADAALGGEAVVQLLFAPAPGRARGTLRGDAARLLTGKPRRSLTASVFELFVAVLFAVGRAIVEVFSSGPSTSTASLGTRPRLEPSRWERERAAALSEKAGEPLFVCSLRLGVCAASRALVRACLGDLADSFEPFQTGAGGGLRRRRELGALKRLRGRVLPWRPALLVSASELAALAPFPERPAETALPFEQAPARALEPAAVAPEDGLVLGTTAAGRPVRVRVDGLRGHAQVLGGTWAGKSTLLLNLGLQLVEQGYGLVVVEPKGDLVEALLSRIPARRAEDVVLLDFGERAFPPAFNLLAGGPGQGEALAAICSRLFGGNWGPRSDDLLRAAILTLEQGHSPGETPALADVLPLLQEARVRRRYHVHDLVLEGFWRAWERASEGQRQQALAPLANKLRTFLLRPALRDALVQPEAPDLREVIASGRILLCSLPAGALGEEGASLLGSVFLHRLWQTAQTLGPSVGLDRKPLICLVDEAHRFTALPGGIGELLAQARGYGLGFVLAHQDLAQLTPELRDAVAANCRSKLCFQLDPPDNQRIARHFTPHPDADDLLRLGRYQLAARLFDNGLVLPAITATAPPPPEPAETGVEETVRMRHRLQGRTQGEIETLLRARYPSLGLDGEASTEADAPPAGTAGSTTDLPPGAPGPSPTHADDRPVGNSDNLDDEEDHLWPAA